MCMHRDVIAICNFSAENPYGSLKKELQIKDVVYSYFDITEFGSTYGERHAFSLQPTC